MGKKAQKKRARKGKMDYEEALAIMLMTHFGTDTEKMSCAVCVDRKDGNCKGYGLNDEGCFDCMEALLIGEGVKEPAEIGVIELKGDKITTLKHDNRDGSCSFHVLSSKAEILKEFMNNLPQDIKQFSKVTSCQIGE